jgi:hypothetical protein
MPQLTVNVVDVTGALGGRDLSHRLRQLVEGDKRAKELGARAATTTTRNSFHYRREIIPPRAGRSSTGGQMKQNLRWTVRNDAVEFDIQEADERVPHWIIQEIGTGERATLFKFNEDNPIGRPKKGATYIRTVKSQRGRRISGGLVFASGGRYTPPGARRDQQLHWASQVLGVPHRSGTVPFPARQAARIRISREIEGQHFVKKGGEQGFREYRESVLAAARQAFRKSNRP